VNILSEERNPWWVERRMTPSQVWDWLQQNHQNTPSLPEKTWYYFLERKKRHGLRVEKTNTEVSCPKCGHSLQIFLVPKTRFSIVAQNQNEATEKMKELSKLISGFYCFVCGRSFFLEDFNEDMLTESAKPIWLLKFVREISKEKREVKEETEPVEIKKDGLEKWF